MLGQYVDIGLTDNFLINGARHVHHLEGKSGKIPNPLVGEGKLKEDGSTVKTIEKDGVLTPVVLPSVNYSNTDGKHEISVSVDASQEKQIPEIVNKICKRNDIDLKRFHVNTSRTAYSIEHPVVEMSTVIDFGAIELGLLKIAYEHTATAFPNYLNDPLGKIYSAILHAHDKSLLSQVRFKSNCMDDVLKKLLESCVDFDHPSRHYLYLAPVEGRLCCFVRLFDIFSCVIEMSDSAYLPINDGRLLINDFSKKSCQTLSLYDLVQMSHTWQHNCYFFSEEGEKVMQRHRGDKAFDFVASKDGSNLIYNSMGFPITTEQRLLKYMADDDISYEDEDGNTSILYHLSPGNYFRLHPSGDLVEVRIIKSISTSKKV